MDVMSCRCSAVRKACSKKCSCAANALSSSSYCVCESGGNCFNSLTPFESAGGDGGYEEGGDFDERYDE